ncbi:HNH endonuclease [Streptomyces phage Sham]|nr:HNH endonuclease [Streptomyces phage Sham]
MKQCSRCNTEKPISQFRKKAASSDGLTPWCRQCFADYDKIRYQNGDDKRKKRNKAISLNKNRAYLWGVLTSSECIDCGERDPFVLEFDHRDALDKTANISDMIHRNGWEAIKDEIAKCDVRCANCHRRRTITQLGLWKLHYQH